LQCAREKNKQPRYARFFYCNIERIHQAKISGISFKQNPTPPFRKVRKSPVRKIREVRELPDRKVCELPHCKIRELPVRNSPVRKIPQI
jgi:hypothetical protein